MFLFHFGLIPKESSDDLFAIRELWTAARNRNIETQIGKTKITSNQLGYVSYGEHLANGFEPTKNVVMWIRKNWTYKSNEKLGNREGENSNHMNEKWYAQIYAYHFEDCK